MRASLLPIRGLDGGTVARWRALSARAVEPNPFGAPDMALAAARHLPGGEQDRLLAVHDGDAMVLALPVRRFAGYRRVPVTTVRAWGHAHAFLDTPLVAPGDLEQAWSAALGALAGSGAGWLSFERLPGDGPVRTALAAAAPGAALHVVAASSRPIARRRPGTSGDDRLSAQRRKKLRQARRRLEAQLGAPLSARDRAADRAPAIDRFLALERTGWKGRAGTALACAEGEAETVRAALAGARDVQLWELGADDGPPVAALCAIVAGGVAFHLKTAYDERFAAHSPGLQLEVAVLDALHGDPALAAIDSCVDGDGPSPSHLLYAERRRVESVVVALGGVRTRAAARVLSLARG